MVAQISHSEWRAQELCISLQHQQAFFNTAALGVLTRDLGTKRRPFNVMLQEFRKAFGLNSEEYFSLLIRYLWEARIDIFLKPNGADELLQKCLLWFHLFGQDDYTQAINKE